MMMTMIIRRRMPSNLRHGHPRMSSLAVTWQRWRSHHTIRRIRKPPCTHKRHGSIFHRTGVMGDRTLYCGNMHFGRFRLLWPWPFPDDLHIRTWPVLPGYIPDVQIWTSYVKAFESYRQTDRQRESTEIINHAASRVINSTSNNIIMQSNICPEWPVSTLQVVQNPSTLPSSCTLSDKVALQYTQQFVVH